MVYSTEWHTQGLWQLWLGSGQDHLKEPPPNAYSLMRTQFSWIHFRPQVLSQALPATYNLHKSKKEMILCWKHFHLRRSLRFFSNYILKAFLDSSVKPSPSRELYNQNVKVDPDFSLPGRPVLPSICHITHETPLSTHSVIPSSTLWQICTSLFPPNSNYPDTNTD